MRSPHARFDGSLNCQPGADYGLGTLAGLEIKQETTEVRRTRNTENLGVRSEICESPKFM